MLNLTIISTDFIIAYSWIGIAFHTDILLALVVVSLIYLYLGLYLGTKCYYKKSKEVIYVRN